MSSASTLALSAALLAGLSLNAGAARAQETHRLAQYVSDFTGGMFGIATSARQSTYLSTQFGVFSGEGTLFDDIIVTHGEHRFDTMYPGDDPDWDRYVGLLTDGDNWWLYDLLNFNNGNALGAFGRESDRLPIGRYPYPPERPYPDLFGMSIEYIEREITISLITPGSDPNGDGNWTDIEYEIRTSVYGVPAPGSVGILIGAGVLATRRRR